MLDLLAPGPVPFFRPHLVPHGSHTVAVNWTDISGHRTVFSEQSSMRQSQRSRQEIIRWRAMRHYETLMA